MKLPAIEMFGTAKFVLADGYSWSNYNTAQNPFEGPWWWWSNFKFMVPSYRPIGKK